MKKPYIVQKDSDGRPDAVNFRAPRTLRVDSVYYNYYLILSGGSARGMGKLSQTQRFHNRRPFPRASEIHSGMPRVQQSVGDIRSDMLSLPADGGQERTDNRNFSSSTRSGP